MSASIANARFKSFQVQYEILSKNPMLSAIAQEIPWKNLLDLFLLKFYAVGDVLWHQDEQPHDMAFVLCGGFVARHMELPAVTSTPGLSSSNEALQPSRDRGLGTILAEKMIKPGGSLAALTVHSNTQMQYAVVTAKFKSIVLSLPAGKYKSILRQITPELKRLVEHSLYETENTLLATLKMRVITPPKEIATTKHSHSSTSDKQTGKPKYNSPRKNHPGNNNSHSLQRAASTPALSSSALTNSTAMSLDATASWASLQVAKPVEHEVNSSLLILHQPSPSSTGNRNHLAPSAAMTKKSISAGGSGLLHSSSVARLTAKKHTQRRLQSIKTPNPLEAFPPQPKNANDLMDQAMLTAFSNASGARASHLDVVPKVHVGRLLKPLRKPAMFNDDTDFESATTSRLTGKQSSKADAGALTRPHTVGTQEHQYGQRVLVSNRAEPFRDLW